MRNTAALITIAFALVAVANAQQQPTVTEITGEDELVKKKSGTWPEAWVHPDADISKYDKLYAWEPVFQFRDVEPTNATSIALSRGNEEAYTIRPEDQETFKKVVTGAVVEELGRSKTFELVDTISPGTLIVRGLVLDIISRVPPNATRRGNMHLTAVGEATFIFELIDAETGVIQARVGDRRLIQPPDRMFEVSTLPTNASTVWMDVERWALDQARELRKALDKAAKKAER